MRKGIIFGLAALSILATYRDAEAQPLRRAKEVARVGNRYTLTWIIRPTEENRGDQKVSNAPDTDLRAISAANDRWRLRIDILLHNPVNYRKKILYAFRVKYKGNVEDVFAYYPSSRKFVLVTMRAGRVTKRRNLRMQNGKLWAEVGDTFKFGRRVKNSRVTLYIPKDRFFSRVGKGRRKFITAQFFSGFIRRGDGVLREADRTIVVRLSYIR